MDPGAFVKTNIYGTYLLLEQARRKGTKKFLQVSTDEVYGSLGETGKFREETPLAPNSPYSASKASADLLAMAYHRTFGLPVVITRCSNNYGPYQFPEKLIPLLVSNALVDRELPIYGDGLNVRDWIHVSDHCAALALVLEKGVARQRLQRGRRQRKDQPRNRGDHPGVLAKTPEPHQVRQGQAGPRPQIRHRQHEDKNRPRLRGRCALQERDGRDGAVVRRAQGLVGEDQDRGIPAATTRNGMAHA